MEIDLVMVEWILPLPPYSAQTESGEEPLFDAVEWLPLMEAWYRLVAQPGWARGGYRLETQISFWKKDYEKEPESAEMGGDWPRVQQLLQRFREGKEVDPPTIVEYLNGDGDLVSKYLDGRHRVVAAYLAGIQRVPLGVVELPLEPRGN